MTATNQIIANIENAFKQLKSENEEDLKKLSIQSDALISRISPYDNIQEPTQDVRVLADELASKLESIVMELDSGKQNNWIIKAIFGEGDHFFAATYLLAHGYYKDEIWHERADEVQAREALLKGQSDLQIKFDGEFFGKDKFYNKMMVGIKS